MHLSAGMSIFCKISLNLSDYSLGPLPPFLAEMGGMQWAGKDQTPAGAEEIALLRLDYIHPSQW